MRISHLILIGVAATSVGAIGATPVAAQSQEPEAMSPMPPAASLTAEQQAEVDAWPVEQQNAYRAWPAETQSYYWTLTDQRKGWFWRLRDDAKIAITAMTGPEREAAWGQIEQAVASNPG